LILLFLICEGGKLFFSKIRPPFIAPIFSTFHRTNCCWYASEKLTTKNIQKSTSKQKVQKNIKITKSTIQVSNVPLLRILDASEFISAVDRFYVSACLPASCLFVVIFVLKSTNFIRH
jgi:hypothetical protein